MLVWPGQRTMTLFPMLPTAAVMVPPRPCPKASRRTTETTPQAIPSMVRMERMRLRSSEIQLCSISSLRYMLHLGSFVAQAFGRFHVGGPLRRVHACVHGEE